MLLPRTVHGPRLTLIRYSPGSVGGAAESRSVEPVVGGDIETVSKRHVVDARGFVEGLEDLGFLWIHRISEVRYSTPIFRSACSAWQLARRSTDRARGNRR